MVVSKASYSGYVLGRVTFTFQRLAPPIAQKLTGTSSAVFVNRWPLATAYFS